MLIHVNPDEINKLAATKFPYANAPIQQSITSVFVLFIIFSSFVRFHLSAPDPPPPDPSRRKVQNNSGTNPS